MHLPLSRCFSPMGSTCKKPSLLDRRSCRLPWTLIIMSVLIIWDKCWAWSMVEVWLSDEVWQAISHLFSLAQLDYGTPAFVMHWFCVPCQIETIDHHGFKMDAVWFLLRKEGYKYPLMEDLEGLHQYSYTNQPIQHEILSFSTWSSSEICFHAAITDSLSYPGRDFCLDILLLP